MPRSVTEIATAAGGGIVALAGVLNALATFKGSAQPILEWLGIAQVPWLPWALTGLLLLLGAALLGRGLARKSRLLQPERLLIDPDNPDHLRGRTDEIRRLRAAVAARPLVFLEGESGCGKSALIRSGLIPALRGAGADAARDQALLPIYLDSYGEDWDQGPRERLVGAAWAALGEERRGRLGIAAEDDLRQSLFPAQGPSLFRRIRTTLGLVPLLILDQFDDYQVSQRGHFLDGGRWIGADELAAASPTWRRIRDELGQDALHLLIVTRRDLYAGLEAVRFVPPAPHTLDRVEPAYIAALLEALTQPGADAHAVALPDWRPPMSKRPPPLPPLPPVCGPPRYWPPCWPWWMRTSPVCPRPAAPTSGRWQVPPPCRPSGWSVCSVCFDKRALSGPGSPMVPARVVRLGPSTTTIWRGPYSPPGGAPSAGSACLMSAWPPSRRPATGGHAGGRCCRLGNWSASFGPV